MTAIDAYCVMGPGSGPVPSGEDELLGLMDSCGVGMAVLHPPGGCYAFYNEQGNERLMKASRGHPGRFTAAVTASPWRTDCWDIIKKAIDEGAGMLTFDPGVQGFLPAGDKLDAVLEKLAVHRPETPVYVHTGHHSWGAPSQLMLLAGRHEQLKFIMGHSGATDYAVDVNPVMRCSPNIYAETSFSRPPAVKDRVAALGAERIIMGSGWPCNRFEFEWSEIRRLLTSGEAEAVCGGNILRLLGAGK